MVIMLFLAPEDVEIEPEHIKCGQTGHQVFNGEEELVAFEGCHEDFVLAEEPGKEGNPGDGEAGDQETKEVISKKVGEMTSNFIPQFLRKDEGSS